MALTLPHRFTVDDFERMVETGILTKEDRVELIEGQVVEMSPIGMAHGAAVDSSNQAFGRACGDLALVRVQGPVRLPSDSQVQPDVALLKPRATFYRDAYPGPEDVLLIVEVADSSLLVDRNTKVPVYARAGIREVWLVNLLNGTVEVFQQPAHGQYGRTRIARMGERLSPEALPSVEVDVSALLGH